MGYEVKMFIGENAIGMNSMKRGKKEHNYFQVIAELDLCKTPIPFTSLTPLNKVYLFGLDGNKEFTEDRYGDALKAYKATDVLKLLQNVMKADKAEHMAKYPADKYTPYRRYVLAEAMLKTVIKAFYNTDIAVCFFGH